MIKISVRIQVNFEHLFYFPVIYFIEPGLPRVPLGNAVSQGLWIFFVFMYKTPKVMQNSYKYYIFQELVVLRVEVLLQ